MKKITLFLCGMVMALGASANIQYVDSISGYAGAYGAALDGDTVMFRVSGEVKNQNFPAGKVITVMAADTCEVSLTGQISGDGVGDGSGIKFENLTIGNGASYLFNFAPQGNIECITFKNCVLENVSRCTFYMSGDAAATSVKLVDFEYSTLRNLNSGNWNMSWHSTPIYKWVINECTLYGNEGMECFYNPTGSYGDKNHEFIFTHNTMYSGCRDANRTICNVTNKFSGTDCKLVFTDNIIVCPDGKSAGKLYSIKAGYWDATVTNNLFHVWACDALSEELGDMTLENNYTLEGLGVSSPAGLFADAANGDFTIYNGATPLATLSTTGGPIGATKWFVENPGPLVTLTTGLAEGVDASWGKVSGPAGLMPQGNSVTLTATASYGYKFVKWVDAAGTTLSEEATYTFTMDTDKTVYAVFAAQVMYTLKVQCNGGGFYSLSDAGQDGKYVEGTEVVITAVTNKITEFVMASDSASGEEFYSKEFTITMNKDYNITMEFVRGDFICCWNFTDETGLASGGATQNRPADILSECYTDSVAPQLDLYYTLYPDAPWTKGWWNRTDTYTSAVTWLRCTDLGDGTEFKTEDGKMDTSKYYTNQGFYWQTCVNTQGYKSDINFCFNIKRTYMGHYEYFVQMSYNGYANSWETVDTVSSTGWTSYEVELPNTAKKEAVYIRLIPNTESAYDVSRMFDVYGVYVAEIYLIAESATGIETVKAEEEETVIYDLMGRRVQNMDRSGIYIVNGKKYLVR